MSGVWKRLFTAMKGGINESAEAVADSQAIRILEQQLREAREELTKSNHALTQIMAKRKLADQKAKSLQDSISQYESHARKASEKGEQTLALECATKVVELRRQVEQEQQTYNQYLVSEQKLKDNIQRAQSSLNAVQQKLDTVKANDAVQKAQIAVSSHHLGANSKMKSAVDSLDRINRMQAQRQAEIEAAEELAATESGSDLEQRLQQAGVSGSQSSADDELARILGQK